MEISKPEGLSQLSGLKGDSEVSDTSGGVCKDNELVITPSVNEGYVINTNGIRTNYGGNSNVSDEGTDGTYSPFANDEVSKFFGVKVVEETATEDFQTRVPADDTPTVFVNHERLDKSDKTNGIIQSLGESSGVIIRDGSEAFKDASVQTVHDKSLISNNSCPVCKLENRDLKNRLTAFCLEFSFKKRKFMGLDKEVLNASLVQVDEAFDDDVLKKKVAYTDDQILPKCVSIIQDLTGGNRSSGCRRSSSRTIRLGLSRRVKLPPLHQTSNSRKTDVAESDQVNTV